MTNIPKQFIRVWLGPNEIPAQFEEWWNDFQTIHPDYKFITVTDDHEYLIPDSIKSIYDNVKSYASRSDIMRIVALKEFGGVYVDTDIKPLKSFDPLLENNMPFAAKRSSKSFEIAVLGSPKNHSVLDDTIEALPKWYNKHSDRSCSVATGPAFISSVWFGRGDVRHFPMKYFYAFNGFGAPNREEKNKMFSENDFDADMYCAHFSNHRWGGNPNKKKT